MNKAVSAEVQVQTRTGEWVSIVEYTGGVAEEVTKRARTMQDKLNAIRIPAIVIEPKVELPTEPGMYFTAAGTQDELGIWHTDRREFHYLNTDGNWSDIGWGAPSPDARLTHLEPVAVTAKRVIDAVRKAYHTDDPTYWGNLDRIEREFGVTE